MKNNSHNSYTLVAAIHAMGGPVIPWSSGRIDARDASAVTPDGRLPNADSGPKGSDPADAAHVRAIFNRMGFNDQEIVALSGAHALGRCHTCVSIVSFGTVRSAYTHVGRFLCSTALPVAMMDHGLLRPRRSIMHTLLY
jgi:catalase (peroxidase I)